MPNEEPTAVTIEFDSAEFDRLAAVADSPEDLIHEATMGRVEVKEAIDYTEGGGFHGPNGFAKIKENEYPTWPLRSLLGIELQSIGGGESRWTMEAGPEHANPMGTIHGGELCDLGAAALSTAYVSTLDDDELFTTADLDQFPSAGLYRPAGGERRGDSPRSAHRRFSERHLER